MFKILLLLQFNMYSYCCRSTTESRTCNKMFALHNIKLNDFMSQLLYAHCHNVTFMWHIVYTVSPTHNENLVCFSNNIVMINEHYH